MRRMTNLISFDPRSDHVSKYFERIHLFAIFTPRACLLDPSELESGSPTLTTFPGTHSHLLA